MPLALESTPFHPIPEYLITSTLRRFRPPPVSRLIFNTIARYDIYFVLIYGRLCFIGPCLRDLRRRGKPILRLPYDSRYASMIGDVVETLSPNSRTQNYSFRHLPLTARCLLRSIFLYNVFSPIICAMYICGRRPQASPPFQLSSIPHRRRRTAPSLELQISCHEQAPIPLECLPTTQGPSICRWHIR